MAFVIVIVFINIQLIIDESLSQVFPNQINEAFTNMNVRKAVTVVLVGIAQLVEHQAETDQLTFIKRHRAFESRKLRLLSSFLFIYNSSLYFLYILLLFSFICLFYFLYLVLLISSIHLYKYNKPAYYTFS